MKGFPFSLGLRDVKGMPLTSLFSPRQLALPTPMPLPRAAAGPFAIVTPVINGHPTPDEAVGLKSLCINAGHFRHIILAPDRLTLRPELLEREVLRVPDAVMASRAAYNAMLLSPWFWTMFESLDQILIFQLDCLLLKPDLARWVGAPGSFWGAPSIGRHGRLRGGMNGGFSLRRPADHLAVLGASGLNLRRLSKHMVRQFMKPSYARQLLAAWLAASTPARGDEAFGERFASAFGRAEDEFWSYFAPLLSAEFTLPSPREAAAFAFEERPEQVLAMTGGMPLGAHAWAMYCPELAHMIEGEPA